MLPSAARRRSVSLVGRDSAVGRVQSERQSTRRASVAGVGIVSGGRRRSSVSATSVLPLIPAERKLDRWQLRFINEDAKQSHISRESYLSRCEEGDHAGLQEVIFREALTDVLKATKRCRSVTRMLDSVREGSKAAALKRMQEIHAQPMPVRQVTPPAIPADAEEDDETSNLLDLEAVRPVSADEEWQNLLGDLSALSQSLSQTLTKGSQSLGQA